MTGFDRNVVTRHGRLTGAVAAGPAARRIGQGLLIGDLISDNMSDSTVE
jgi:hypothetical protein